MVATRRRRELWEAFGPSVEVIPEEEVPDAGDHKEGLKIRCSLEYSQSAVLCRYLVYEPEVIYMPCF